MRVIVSVTCALCVATSSRADPPPAEATAAVAARPPAAAPVAAAPVAPPAKRSRIPEIVATTVTGGFVIATAAAYWKWDQAYDLRRAAPWDRSATLEEHNRYIEDANRWKERTWILIGGTFVSAAVTTFMWMRNQDPASFSVQPAGDGAGATAWYSGRF
jgi:hypothetical protein